ncbi:MAG TPA: tetratricopeptide repeat protein, partial [Polyangia bacterium]
MSRALAIVFALVIVGGVARAEPTARAATEARRHLQRGNTLYQQGRYDEAVAELQAGYALDPRPDFLYAIGQAERKRGDCNAAIRYYQQYVNTGQSPQRTVAVLMQIDRCKEELAAAPATPSKAPAPSTEAPAPAEPATPPPPVVATPEP